MITITIDNKKTGVEPGTTILEAAHKLGIEIPTLCHVKGLEPSTSCMVCMVKRKGKDAYLPACAAKAEDGMEVESDTEAVKEMRKKAVELLLSEHTGDCSAPCRITCPAGMDIPRMIRRIRDGELKEAAGIIKKDIALPATLGRICPAPCEKACRRKLHDAPVAICLLKRFASDADLSEERPFQPPCGEKKLKHAAIVGAGPGGLAASYYLLQNGIDCTVYDKNEKAGGGLQYNVPDKELPRDVLNAEIRVIEQAGARFELKKEVGPAGFSGTSGSAVALPTLLERFDAVLLAAGKSPQELAQELAIPEETLKPSRLTYETGNAGLFMLPKAPQKLSIRALANGKEAARSITGYLLQGKAAEKKKPFNSRIGALQEHEIETFMKQARPAGRNQPPGGASGSNGFSSSQAREEAQRCLHCDCRKIKDCRLKHVAELLDAKPSSFRGARREFTQFMQHADVVFEPGKCISCGVCIKITEKAGEPLGLTFINRGFDVRIGIPFDEPLKEALTKAARECVAACPTGALAFKE